MKYRKITLLVIVVLTGSPLLSAGQGRKEWKVEGGALKLHDETGHERKRMDLYERRDKEYIKAKTTGEMVEIQVNRISRAKMSGDGRYVAHVTQELRNYGYEYTEATTTVRYLDSDGRTIWKKHAVDLYRGINVADDGRYVTLVVTTRDGCGSGNDCKWTGIILDNRGQEMMRFGPSYGVITMEMSNNGRYVMVNGAQEETIFVDVERRKTVLKEWRNFRGLPRILDDGTVEIVGRHYEGEPPNRKVTREEITDIFKIE